MPTSHLVSPRRAKDAETQLAELKATLARVTEASEEERKAARATIEDLQSQLQKNEGELQRMQEENAQLQAAQSSSPKEVASNISANDTDGDTANQTNWGAEERETENAQIARQQRQTREPKPHRRSPSESGSGSGATFTEKADAASTENHAPRGKAQLRSRVSTKHTKQIRYFAKVWHCARACALRLSTSLLKEFERLASASKLLLRTVEEAAGLESAVDFMHRWGSTPGTC